ncbi:MAG: FtsH protease activity modulator HflK [Desulfovibrionaceae bacterium]|nr:FtsH protease activity modulator HflK [Desulfovibrionaceae bacterium]
MPEVLKNWDWDKLQEKRARQQGYTPPPRDEEERSEPQGEEKPRRSLWGRGEDRNDSGGSGGGSDGRGPRLTSFKMPSPAGGTRGIVILLLIVVAVWLLSGIYIVNPDEEGVVLRFGKYNRSTEPGPHYALPIPLETVYKPKVTQVLRSEIGYRNVGQSSTFQQGRVKTMPQEASMLTGDENVVNVQFSVQYRIKDAVQYLFNVADPTSLVHNAAEAAMREVIGNNLIDAAITDGKLQIQNDATQLLQVILDRYGAGIQVLAVQLQDVHPPQEVVEAFKDVASAREDKSRIINEAEAYRNALLPGARGEASAIRNEAEAYSATRVQHAEGAANRFNALRVEYEKAPEVTKQRLYYETMEEILQKAQEKVVMDGQAAERALPYLPLPTLAAPGKAPQAAKEAK